MSKGIFAELLVKKNLIQKLTFLKMFLNVFWMYSEMYSEM